MKNLFLCLVLLSLCSVAQSQWKVRNIENFEGRHKEVYVASKSGNEIFMFKLFGKNIKEAYIITSNNLVKGGFPINISFRFNNDIEIYSIKIQYNPWTDKALIDNKYVYKCDIKWISMGGPSTADKEFVPWTGRELNYVPIKHFISLFETHDKMFCRISFNDIITNERIANKFFDMEFSLQNFKNAFNSD